MSDSDKAKIYSISFTRSARKDLDNLDRAAVQRIRLAVDALINDPRPYGYVKVKSEKGVFRIRVGEYRVGYEIDDAAQEVTVIRVAPRSEFYD